MADPTSVSGAVVSVGVFGLSVVFGVHELVVLASITGAVLAGAQSTRLDWSVRAVAASLASFAASVLLGVAGGLLGGAVLVSAAARLGLGGLLDGHVMELQMLFALFLSLYGVSMLLPAAARRLGAEIETRGAGQ